MMTLSNNPHRSPLGAFVRSPLGVMDREEAVPVGTTYHIAIVSMPWTEGASPWRSSLTRNSYRSIPSAAGYARWASDKTIWDAHNASKGNPTVNGANKYYAILQLFVLPLDVNPLFSWNESFREWCNPQFTSPTWFTEYVLGNNEINRVGFTPTLYGNQPVTKLYDTIRNLWLTDSWAHYVIEGQQNNNTWYHPSGPQANPVKTFQSINKDVPNHIEFHIENSTEMSRATIAALLNYAESQLTAVDGITYNETLYTTGLGSTDQGRWVQWFNATR